MIDTTDLCLRLAASVFAGALIGINRETHGKAAGVRTFGLVGLGSALMTLSGSGFIGGMDANASRAVQGIVTGIGFLGAGVIVKRESQSRVHGLTTAAAIWVASAFGIACGLGQYRPVVIGLGLMIALLLFGGLIDRAIQTWTCKKGEARGKTENR